MGIKEKIKLPTSRRGRIVLYVLLAVTLAGGIGAVYYRQAEASPSPQSKEGRRNGGPGNRIQAVKATQVRQGNLDIAISALGTVTASNTAVVRPRVDGQLIRIAFREGQTVKAGDLLAEIDPRPFQIQLEQARGQLTRDEALLGAAQVDLERYRQLLAKDSIAGQQVDTQAAQVRQYQGVVEADRAAVANARLQLDFTRIVAPASGRLGLRQVDLGNNVRSSDSNGIVVITQTQPIHVVFAIPADHLSDILKRQQNSAPLNVEAWSRDGRTLVAKGRLISIDNQIDVSTGTVRLKAEFGNPDNSLFPNQFVNIRLKVETRVAATLLATAAIQRNAEGPFVFVIDPAEQTVSPRQLELGPGTADTTIIEKGLKAGDQVVLDGGDRVRPGGKVDVISLDGKPLAREAKERDKAAGDAGRPQEGGDKAERGQRRRERAAQ